MNQSMIVLALLASSFAAACTDRAPDRSAGAPAESAAASGAVEEALADAETGRDVAKSRLELASLLTDKSLSSEDRARVDVALAKLLATTDAARAVTLLEDAVSLGNEGATSRLFTLLAGHEPPSEWKYRDDTPVAAFATALTRFYPTATPDRQVEIDIVRFGGAQYERASNDLGTFSIGAALRRKAAEACGWCDEVKTSIHTHSSGLRLWSSIPQYVSRLEKAVTILYVDAQTMVPERYAKWLAMPIADIAQAIDHGQGVFAVKERPGAPPLVTIAAPRAAQLVTVETALSELSELPRQPVTVKLDEALTEREIEDGLRLHGGGGTLGCTNDLMKRNPSAAWDIDLKYTVKGTGEVAGFELGGKVPDDAAFRSCLSAFMSRASFPAWSKKPGAKFASSLHLVSKIDVRDFAPGAGAIGTDASGNIVRFSR